MTYIPESVIFVGVPKTKEAKNHNNKLIYVYIADADKTEQIESAKNKVSRTTNQDVVFCYDNVPMTGLTIDNFSDDLRKQTFLVYNKDNFCFDVDRAEILECMLTHGVKKGGILGGEWIIGREHGKSPVLLVGGNKHKKFLQQTEFNKNLKKIKSKEIVPGFIFKNKKQSAWWYAGDYKTMDGNIKKCFITYRISKTHSYAYEVHRAPATFYSKEPMADDIKRKILQDLLKRNQTNIDYATQQITDGNFTVFNKFNRYGGSNEDQMQTELEIYKNFESFLKTL